MIDFLSRQTVFLSIRLLIPLAEWLRSSILKMYRAFPFKSVLDYFYLRSSTLQFLFAYQLNPAETNNKPTFELTAQHLARIASFELEELSVRTADGFLLTMHHVQSSNAKSKNKNKNKNKSKSKTNNDKAQVLIIHALMQSSNTFLLGGSTSLVAVLLNAGYDVWLGNCRGNMYSEKHERYGVKDKRYWDFSIDELAKFDLPAMVNTIRVQDQTSSSSSSLVLLGFSQGSAIIAAALASKHIKTHDIAAFIALAPAIKVKGLSHNFLADLVQARSHLLLGNTSCLSSTLLWREFLSPKAFSALNVVAMEYLFGWHSRNISLDRRVQFFQHIFSNTSAKIVKHWFQIIACNDGIVSEYDDNNKNKSRSRSNQRHARTSSRPWLLSWLKNTDKNSEFEGKNEENLYDISAITCPIAVFAGSADHLIDPMYIQNKNSNCILTHIEEGYEHLDMIWGDSAHEKIFPKVVEVIDAVV